MKSYYRKIAMLGVSLCLGSMSLAQEVSSVWEGVYTAQEAMRGEVVYNEACIACHGQDLGGNSNSPGLVGMGFMFLWEGRTLGSFFEKICSEMPTDRPGKLPVQDYLDVVAYIMQKNGFPEGDVQLPSSVKELSAITIVSGQ